jgi:hypothetical protein
MVEFEYQPWKKFIVHEVVKFPIEFFLSQHSMGIQSGGIGRPLNWVDGIVFSIGPFRETDDVIKEKLEGKVHYSSIVYGVLEKYQSEFKLEGNIRIPVMDISDNKIFKEMIVWIKKTFEQK